MHTNLFFESQAPKRHEKMPNRLVGMNSETQDVFMVLKLHWHAKLASS